MAIINDWLGKAAAEILDTQPIAKQQILDILAKHCPFAMDTAYVTYNRKDDEELGLWRKLFIPKGSDFGPRQAYDLGVQCAKLLDQTRERLEKVEREKLMQDQAVRIVAEAITECSQNLRKYLG